MKNKKDGSRETRRYNGFTIKRYWLKYVTPGTFWNIVGFPYRFDTYEDTVKVIEQGLKAEDAEIEGGNP